jgi:hypothetical protein
MALFDFLKKPVMKEAAQIKPAIYVKEEFKGKIEPEKLRGFQAKQVGEPHPFDFEIVEKWYKDDAFISGVVDKFVDFIIGAGFYATSKDPRAEELTNQFMDELEFPTLLRTAVRDMLIYGNGYIEISGRPNEIPTELKVLNPKHIYIQRDEYGKVLAYNQWFGKGNPIRFEDSEICHLAHRIIGDSAYGIGIIWPLTYTLKKKTKLVQDMCMLIERKANSPIVATLGTKEEPVSAEDIEAFGAKLDWLHNKHEWTVNHLVKLETLQFGDIGQRFTEPLRILNEELVYGSQVPEVLLGKGSIPEGLAQVQMQAFQKRIESIQEEIEKEIEQKIFNRLMIAHGMGGVHVEFNWGAPSTSEKREEIKTITELLKLVVLSKPLRIELENRLAELMELEVPKEPEAEREQEETEPQPRVPGTTEIFTGELIK